MKKFSFDKCVLLHTFTIVFWLETIITRYFTIEKGFCEKVPGHKQTHKQTESENYIWDY